MPEHQYVRWFDDLNSSDTALVGGKNASLGEMIGALKKRKIRVPDGFATTADAYRAFVEENDLRQPIEEQLAALERDEKALEKVGKSIRSLFLRSDFPEEVGDAIVSAYSELCAREDTRKTDVAVRSSATAEDLPEASFAGQQETFLNVTGEKKLLDACKKCYASLFTDRAISYRAEKGFDHMEVALSVGVQKMVRSDKGGAGVMFTLDTETGFPDTVVINAAWGLGENVVQGTVNPDEYVVFKPALEQKKKCPILDKVLGAKEQKMVYARGGGKTTKNVDVPKKHRASFVLEDDEILRLARWGCIIEEHYGKPMDIEWAKDGQSGELFIVQARPETVQSQKHTSSLRTFELEQKGKVLVSGLSIGDAIAAGNACVIKSASDIDAFEDDAVLVTEMTDPDWVPIMKRAAGIVADHGGRTSHAAIVSRELGIPAVVGTTDGTKKLKDGQEITLSCAEGDQGHVYEGRLDFTESEIDLEDFPKTRTRIMINISSPPAAFRWWRLPSDGIGLARMEFIINNVIKVHPLALVHFDDLEDKEARNEIKRLTQGYSNKSEYFIHHLSNGIAKIAASQYPNPVIVRTSDFKTNEYADLIGGRQFEPEEENPMLGFRGASRYYSDRYREGFALECRAIRRAREEMGFENVVVMIPFCRTPEEADQVLDVMAKNGLERGRKNLEVYVMCEIPSNFLLADRFAERFDGFSIGSNDLTQLVLGVDRDSTDLAYLFDESHDAVKNAITAVIRAAHEAKRKVGICGEAPSNDPDFAAFLVESGIDSISLSPDSVLEVKRRVAAVEEA